jgi:5-methylcytosine-specific restriction endonuclease McrA
MPAVQCKICGESFNVVPARLKTAKFCSYKCAGEWRKRNFAREANPNYRGGTEKTCQQCAIKFWARPALEQQKFCSKLCADKGGFRYSGKDHPNYRADSRRKNRGGSHHKWAGAVISRDKATCQHCGATEIELHAHHIKPYRDFPDSRFDVDNGMTLCFKCHWAVHTASTANAVNSGNIPLAKAKDNPEPSSQGNLLEGVTTRGRAYRRIIGPCSWCGSVLSKRFSDVANRAHMFCDKRCAGKFNAANRTYRQWKNPDQPMAVISSTSAARESDDIV